MVTFTEMSLTFLTSNSLYKKKKDSQGKLIKITQICLQFSAGNEVGYSERIRWKVLGENHTINVP